MPDRGSKSAASAGPGRFSPPPESAGWRSPWVQLKYYSFHPCIYRAMIGAVSPGVQPGALVFVYDPDGRPFGQGLYNPKARVPLRMVYHGAEPVGEEYFVQLLDRAVDLRVQQLRLADQTDAFRVVHSDGDGLSGLVVDRLGEVLSVQVHSLGVAQRLPAWLGHLHRRLGTRRTMVQVDEEIARLEGIQGLEGLSDPLRTVRIREYGVRYEVDFSKGHKTGFFCDQRENRRRFALWVQGRSVLDLCCYTGGFALAAKVLGGASEVTGVDLDEHAIAQARRNANLNQVRIEWVHVDAFAYARQMQANRRRWQAVVLDPPKFIPTRAELAAGRRKYEDLNSLALGLVEPGGLFVSCCCSGLLPGDEFEQIVIRAAHRLNRRLQVVDRTGAGPDHPVMSNCPESRYLTVLWARVF